MHAMLAAPLQQFNFEKEKARERERGGETHNKGKEQWLKNENRRDKDVLLRTSNQRQI